MMKPKVSVIIPAYNEEKVIHQCLESLDHQSFHDFEVCVIDDASTDRSKEIILNFCNKKPSRFRLFEFGKVGPGKARNRVAYQSEADFLVFTDADCFATPNWLEELLKGFSSEKVGSTGGPHLCPSDSSPFQKRLELLFKLSSFFTDFYKNPGNEIRQTNHNPLCNVAYRREIFMRLRGFREDLFPGEDVEMDFRVKAEGHQITFNQKAIVYHHRPEKPSDFRKVMFNYGRAQGKLVRELGLKRKIQAIGLITLLSLPMWFSYLVLEFAVAGALFFCFGLYIFFFFRPKHDGYFGIFFNSLEWFNGFIDGLWNGRSLPPGSS